MVSLVAELRGYERQAAEELGQWKTCVDERKPPRRIARRRSRLALLMTAGLEELEKRSLEMEIAGRGQPGGQMSQAVNLLRAIVSLPKYSPPMPRPRRATSDGWTPVDQAESQVLGRLLSELTQEARFPVTAYREM